MRDHWAYEKKRRTDRDGTRWHFVSHYIFEGSDTAATYELYFRRDDHEEYGVARFAEDEHPGRRHDDLAHRIMNDDEYRRPLLDPKTKCVWLKSWK